MKTSAKKAPKKTNQEAAIEDLTPKAEKDVRGGAIRLSDILVSNYSVRSSDG